MKSFVLARKGVLITDPSVEKMTEAQWLFEFEGLRQKEEATNEMTGEVVKVCVDALRNTLIQVLGLNLVHPDDVLPEERESGQPVFIPYSYLGGQPEVMKHVLEKYEKAEEASKATDRAMRDTSFEAFSRDLQRMLTAGQIGDLEPILGKEEPPPEPGKMSRSEADSYRMAGVRIKGDIGQEPASKPAMLVEDAPSLVTAEDMLPKPAKPAKPRRALKMNREPAGQGGQRS
jgi:hypothetical protein